MRKSVSHRTVWGLLALVLAAPGAPARAEQPSISDFLFRISDCRDDDGQPGGHQNKAYTFGEVVTDTGAPSVGITFQDINQGLAIGTLGTQRQFPSSHPSATTIWLSRGGEGVNLRSVTGNHGNVTKSGAYDPATGAMSQNWFMCNFDNYLTCPGSSPNTFPYFSISAGDISLKGQCTYQDTQYGPSNDAPAGPLTYVRTNSSLRATKNSNSCWIWLEDGVNNSSTGRSDTHTNCFASGLYETTSGSIYCSGCSNGTCSTPNYGCSDGYCSGFPAATCSNIGGSCSFGWGTCTLRTGCASLSNATRNPNTSSWECRAEKEDCLADNSPSAEPTVHSYGCDEQMYERYTCSLPKRVSGKYSDAWEYYAGDGQYVERTVGDIDSTTGNFTFLAWVYPKARNSGSENIIMGQGAGSSSMYLGICGSGLSCTADRFIWRVGNSYVHSNAAAPLNTWTLVVGTYQSGVATLYVDGRIQTRMSVSAPGDAGTTFRLGANQSGNYFTGIIDETMMLNRALTQDEVAAHYNPTVVLASADGTSGLEVESSATFGPSLSSVYYNSGSAPSNGTTAAQVLYTHNLPFRYGSNNRVRFIAQDTSYWTAFQNWTVTVQTTAPSGISLLSATGISDSEVQWDLSMSYICNPHWFNGETTVNPQSVVFSTRSVYSQPSTDSYVQGGLGVNAPAGFRVQTGTIYGHSSLSHVATGYTLAHVPTSAQAQAIGFTTMTFRWESNGNPTYTPYEVSLSSDSVSYDPTRVSTPVAFSEPFHLTTSTLLTGLTPATTYYIRVRAQNGNGGWSGGGQKTAFASIGPLPTLPTSPIDLLATATSSDTVVFTWDPVSTAQSYTIYNEAGDTQICQTNSPPFDWKASVPFCSQLSNQTAGTYPAANERLRIRVRTNNASGQSPLTGILGANTLSQPPTSVAVQSVSTNTATLSWQLNGNAPDSIFTINAALDAAFATGVTTQPVQGGTGGTISNLLPGSTYYFRVRTLNGDNVPSLVANVVSTLTVISANQARAVVPPQAATTITVPQDSTRLDIPAGALPSGATIFFSLQPEVNPLAEDATRIQRNISVSVPSGHSHAPDTVREFVAYVNHQASSAPFSLPVTLELPFSDSIRPGYVNNADPPMPTVSLKAYVLHPYLDRWDTLPSQVDLARKVVRVSTNHFSVYSLFGVTLQAFSDLSQLKVYPQPFRPGSGGRFDQATQCAGQAGLYFDNLPEGTTVKLFTLAGEHVRTLPGELGGCSRYIAVWDGKNKAGRGVASGVYLAHVSGPGGEQVVRVAVEK